MANLHFKLMSLVFIGQYLAMVVEQLSAAFTMELAPFDAYFRGELGPLFLPIFSGPFVTRFLLNQGL
jgi:hypothetical protein